MAKVREGQAVKGNDCFKSWGGVEGSPSRQT